MYKPFVYTVYWEEWGQHECTHRVVLSMWTDLDGALWEFANYYSPKYHVDWGIDVSWINIPSDKQKYCDHQDYLVHEEWHVAKALDNVLKPC